MKPQLYNALLFGLALLLFQSSTLAQNYLANTRPNSKAGVSVFEASKTDTALYEGFRIRIGGDFALQFQGIDQSNDGDSLLELGTDFNLPSANLNLSAALLRGVSVHLRTYLSSKHHE